MVKDNAECLDGQRIQVTRGWHLGPKDTSIYIGETAWVTEREVSERFPESPIWIASGDLDFGAPPAS